MTSHKPKKYDKGAIAWMAGNTVAANLCMIVLLVGGLIFCVNIKQEVFPEVELDIVRISIAYPGTSPTEVEQGIVLAVEEAIQGLDDIEEIKSSAREGMASITVELALGADNQKVTQDIKQEIDRITSFPLEAEEPQVTLLSRRRQVLSMVVYGNHSEKSLRLIAENVREQILSIEEVSQVELSGVKPLEISIEISKEELRRYNLSLQQVADIIRKSAVEIPGGSIKAAKGEILLRVKDPKNYGREYAKIPVITTTNGTELLLEDIATINDGFKDVDIFASYNGSPAVMINVFRVGDQTPIQISDAVKKHIAEWQIEQPPGIKLAIKSDDSNIYRQRMDLLLRNGYIGLILVFLLLAIFLKPRLAFWVTMGIPISFLGGFLFLPSMGVSLNMISMFAFIVALGIVVDDAIVVGENIYEHHQNGMPMLQAAKTAAKEVAVPVVFSILTNVVTFMPLFFVPGFMGKIFKVIPAVVVTVFLISLFESLFILPAHLSHDKDNKKGVLAFLGKFQQFVSNVLSKLIKGMYGPLIKRILEFRYLTLSFSVAILVVTFGYVAGGHLGMELFPRVESDRAVGKATLPYGVPIEETLRVQNQIIKAAERVIAANGGNQLAEGIFAEIGGDSEDGSNGSGNSTQIQVYLTPPEKRPIGTAEFVKLWRKEVGIIAGIETSSFVSNAGGPGSGASLTIELTHSDYKILEIASAELAEEIKLFPKTKDIDDGHSAGKVQYDFKILPKGRNLGLTSFDIARQVRNSFYGAEALRKQRGRNEIRVMVRFPEIERQSEYNIEEMLISTPSGGDIPLREVAEINKSRAYTDIKRRNGRRAVNVTSDVTPPSATNQIKSALIKDVFPQMKKKYPRLGYDFVGRQQDMAKSLSSLFKGFIMALFIIYALLAVPFKSYVQPLIIMVSIPFGLVGAVIGHIYMGYSLSIMSMMGIVALAGVVVNDSLILIDFANREVLKGASPFEAIQLSGVRRFRPIILTTLTTFGGLAPMIFETSRQARFLIPMAISLGYGILFATLITLIIVPCLYMAIEDARKIFLFIKKL